MLATGGLNTKMMQFGVDAHVVRIFIKAVSSCGARIRREKMSIADSGKSTPYLVPP